ncbi:DNA polymerase III subunit delta' [Sutcliffiella cohnii]|uniref:DNA polymerase III subunit delta' n=1 Tax=Sutcliffiella cohnii TaxID=33932 RepID=A0A223KWX6_9BACI|nr:MULTISPECIES: DNA polymerase III subunit delta' [Sutcliffiella]AST93961.1 DNA polymerase III subunit delta' [Sutcliffiella cohnii]MED4018436.1 DNA polymerase III subunit delta' [Sutcliffiella cohnii]WBL15164.1 DNA polymerase III subunit delta' [Sutcliffiella sp. NC1]
MLKSWTQLSDVQPTVAKIVVNSLRRDRIAHAYLLDGMKGTGKKETSYLFAKSLFCKNRDGEDPCHQCVNCKRIESRNHPDVHVVEPDGNSIKKHQIQYLQEEFSKTGLESKQKIYIIDHADKMTTSAANSLLKFLEEPNQETYAFLLTENIHRILNTIISRCQPLSFQALTSKRLIDKLVEQGYSPSISTTVAQLTNDMNEALELLTDDWFAEARLLVIKLYETLQVRPQQALLFIHEKWMPHFPDRSQLEIGLDLLLYIYKDMLYAQLQKNEEIVFIDQLELIEKQSLQTTQSKIVDQLSFILQSKSRLASNVNAHLLMEQIALNLQEG